MARKIHTFDKTTEELDNILERADSKPFIRWFDESAGVYRFFPDEKKRDAWVEAYLNDELTPEIAAYEFTEPITAPAPYTINITVLNDNRPILEGTTGVNLEYTFSSLDRNGERVLESVDVYYTFNSPSGTKATSSVYNADPQGVNGVTNVVMNVDKFLSVGKNTITIMARGRSTNASKTVVATFQVVVLDISSTFNIARSIEQDTPFEVTYTVKGDSDKVVEFYIDGLKVANPTISSLEPLATKKQRFNGMTSGKHTLQMLVKMQVGETTFRSKLLYYEFVVKGSTITTTVVSEVFPNTQDVFASGSFPGFNGEQYVVKTINWAYYSSESSSQHATIQWRLYTEGGDEIPIATRTADVIEAETDIVPDPLQFMPSEFGSYNLQALIGNVIIGDYTISVIQNTAGLLETTEGLSMKLSGLGRNNLEPEETLQSWTNGGFSTTFTNQPWNGNSGWNENALWLNNGATALNNNKPFAVEIAPQSRNGCCFEIDFETFNVDNEDAELVRIGGRTGASLVITSNKAVLKSSFGRTLEYQFKSDERIKLSFVVYPNSSTDYYRKMFLYANGVMSQVVSYELADSFNIGSLSDTGDTNGMVNLGNSDGEAGIKVYYIRTYVNFINMYEELNNYFIDSGENLNQLVADNDIYSAGTRIIDVDKLEGTITTVKITGSLDELINRGSGKAKITAALEVVSPHDSTINMHCESASISNAGQSTLDKPVPSFHVKLDKNGNVCYDRDGNILSKNRWVFRKGNVPEKKFRLQANYMDSSGCHNGAFFRLFNEVYTKVKVNGVSVLRIPSEKYATDTYPTAMRVRHGEDPSGNNWKFPYKINMTPDSIPCIVVWRPNSSSSYRFLGQYVIMEEKKSNYANGMHSIYDGVDADGNPDPFGFKSQKSDLKLWDNADCHQVEILRSTEDLTLFLDDSHYDRDRAESFELVYPDEDDLSAGEIEDEWDKFYEDVVHPVVSSRDNQAAFDALLYGENPKLDRWHFAAYYCIAMRNACTDSMVRNMEFVTYEKKNGQSVWLPKWWDVDMQCGLQQTGECNIEPTSDRNTMAPNSSTAYAFSGRMIVNGVLISSWLWDGLEGSEQFMRDVKTMDSALYQAGWTYTQMTKIQDEEYVDAWSKALYNESSVSKYLAYNDLLSLQGDRTPHRHWFLRTSYDYFDALNVCGEYTSKIISIRTQSIAPNKTIDFVAAKTSYFGWGYTTNVIQSGIRVEKGNSGSLLIDRTLALNDPLHIFAANKIAEIDFEPIAECIAGADIDFSGAYDDLLGSQMKVLIIGVSKTRMNQGVFNTSSSATQIQGIDSLNKLERLSIQGMQYFTSLDMSGLRSLKYLYAAGSRLDSFNPASGSSFSIVELPTTVTSMQMDGCNLTKRVNGVDSCVIDWYSTVYNSIGVPTGIVSATIPTTLRVLILNGMGHDVGTKLMVFSWLNAVYDEYGDSGLANLEITCRNVDWGGVSVADLLKLSKIPASQRTVTGKITCSGTITSSDVVAIQEAFGSNVFTNNTGVPLRIDAETGFVIGAPSEILAGLSVTISGISFPIDGSSSDVRFILGTYDGGGNFVSQTRLQNAQGLYYYQYKDTVLYEASGQLVTQETSEPDYHIVVRGTDGIVAGEAEITVKKRTYPTAIDIDVTPTIGKNVRYRSVDSAWCVFDSDLKLTLVASTTPSEINGTVSSDVWSIDNSIASLFRTDVNNGTTLELYLEAASNSFNQGYITHTKTYVDGTTVSKSVKLIIKNPVIVLTSAVNSPLQSSVYTAGYSQNASYATDVELWDVTSLDFATSSGNSLVHLAEINEMVNLDTTILDLSYCTSLGSNDNLVTLEDNTQDYVNVLPRASQTLSLDFEEVDLSNTRLKGVNLKSGSVLEAITYGDYTTKVNLVNQTAVTEVNIPDSAIDSITDFVVEGCTNLEEITWIEDNNN